MCPVLFIAIAAWAIAQVLKLLISIAVYHRFDINYLFTGGGMPSSHSALVCATAVSCGISAGFGSPVFAVSSVLAFIVMYDASHVRRETGEQSKVLNYIMRNWAEYRPEDLERELKELIGHTPLQVAVGGFLGAVVGLAGGFIAYGF